MSRVPIAINPLGTGGGLLDGGYRLESAYTARVDDPASNYVVTMTIDAKEGRLVCEKLLVEMREGGVAPITGQILRSIVVDSYLQHSLYALNSTSMADLSQGLWQQVASTPKWTKWTMGADPHAVALQQQRRRRPSSEVLPEVVRLYREALVHPDPSIRRKPTQYVADELHYDRGHAARLVSMARTKQLLGPARIGRSGELPANPLTPATKSTRPKGSTQ